jgi:ribosomal protein L25 (general stress protein Ctc)
MEIGEVFTFYSNGKKMKALFIEKNKDKIKAVIYDDKMAGIKIEIHESQIITENQISMF